MLVLLRMECCTVFAVLVLLRMECSVSRTLLCTPTLQLHLAPTYMRPYATSSSFICRPVRRCPFFGEKVYKYSLCATAEGPCVLDRVVNSNSRCVCVRARLYVRENRQAEPTLPRVLLFWRQTGLPCTIVSSLRKGKEGKSATPSKLGVNQI